MGFKRRELTFSIVFVACFYHSYGCFLEGTNLPLPVTESVLDTFRGVILDRGTTDIDAIDSVSYGGALNSGPYVDATLSNSRFVITTNDNYENYEENETSQSMAITVIFRCSGGSTSVVTFIISVVDTNNNAPQFLPSNDISTTITAPLPPGTPITGCFNELVVRDIDLTTQRIDFAILDNPNFEIEYDAESSSTNKEFKAIIRTTTFIRTILEPITLTITATDVDLTSDPPLTSTATFTIIGNSDFQLPEVLVFSESFYLAEYTDDNQLVLEEPISLQSGYHELVEFTIEGEFSSNFEPISEGNQVSIRVVNPLSDDVLRLEQILLTVRADREQTTGASATVIVQLPKGVPLEFERAHYEGTIENNNLQVPQLVLSQGYEGASVSAVVLSEHTSYFTAIVQGNIIMLSMTPLDESVINENSFIYLQIVASSVDSSATAIVTLEIIKDDNVTPVFNRPIYTGSYNPDTGLTLEQIVLVQGYDGIVSLVLEGDDAEYFEVSQNGAFVTVNALTIPPEIYNKEQIVLSLEAMKPRTVGANAAVIVTLPAARELGFEAATYRGSLRDNVLNVEPIRLTVGYDDNVVFAIYGDYANYFSISNEQNEVTITLLTPIPSSIILENNIVILTLAASGLNAVMTTTSVLLDIIKDDTTTPVFSRNIYYGTYLDTSNINIEDINLAQGFDDGVTFRLEGEHAQYFGITNTGNNVVLSLQSPIPEEVIFNEKVLLFNVIANRALTVGANAAVSITFPSELTNTVVMRFTQNTYTGTIEDNALTTDNIILDSGYAEGTEFVLTGDYSAFFSLTNSNNVVSVSLAINGSLPIDVIENTFIVLEIEARRERAVSVWTSLVIDIIRQEIVSAVFTEAYYRGVYNADSGLQFDEVISLLSGYDETVEFELDGEFSALFNLVQMGSNSQSIITVAPISDEILRDNTHLLFTINALKSNAITARAVISIDIEKDISSGSLQFSQHYYTGSIEGGSVTLGEMSLEGYSDDVTYAFTGDYADYFQLINLQGVFSLQLLNELPVAIIEANDILVFTLEAQTESLRTHTTIILEIVKTCDADSILVFEEIFYTGSYSEDGVFIFDADIRLSNVLDTPVVYTLEGNNVQWFAVSQTGNAITLTLIEPIPNIVLQNNQQLTFAIRATSPGLNPATATIVITIIKDNVGGPTLGFDRVTYLGTIENNVANIGPITVIEGYTDGVTFGLYGDLASYFTTTAQGSVVNVAIQSPIPHSLIPPNRIIVLEIQASAPQVNTAFATLVFEVIVEDDTTPAVPLAFGAPYYTGSYNTITGLAMEAAITLSEGYDASVQFALEREHAQWFSVVAVGNTATLQVSSAIPGAVLSSNHQLVFIITATRPGATAAQATIVISLTDDEIIDGPTLGFDRVTYLGTIENNVANIGPITVIEGYTDGVTFGLYGDLASYFTITALGSVVNVAIQSPIPDSLIPPNRIIVLEIQASAPQVNTAFATLVFEVIVEDDTAPAVPLAFGAPYYTGSYNTITGLAMEAAITLSEGYDASVQFALEGEHAQWFSVVAVGNTATLQVSSAIPGAVLSSNHQLVFIITATRPGATAAQATIVISLTDDENIDGPTLGFDRVTYLGTIENNVANIGPITVIEGYTDGVTFGLYGDLASYFTITALGSVVNVAIQSPIPDSLIPPNRIIVLEIQASAPQVNTAFATLVFEVIVEDDTAPAVPLAFGAPYYTGSYNTITGLAMEAAITLSEGYDASVQFALEREHAQWFSVVAVGNTATLQVSSAIPGAVLSSNHQLVFIITATRPGATAAQATIVISLTDDDNVGGPTLGFDRVTYLGTIENNVANIGPITVIEGYTDGVTFGLYGDLASYFTTTAQGSVVNVAIQSPIPDSLIPPNRIIVLEIQASAPQVNTAFATLVFEVIVEDDTAPAVPLAFGAPYYTGSYNTITGLAMEAAITLSEGYDASVQFALEGEHAQWFSVVAVGNTATLQVSSAIPGAVLSSNHQLVFIITATRPGATAAQATIVISLTDDDNVGGPTLGFDRVTYLGTIENNVANIGPITVIEGYTDGVTFGLYGDLASYFTTTAQGSVVNVAIQSPIPDSLIPPNRIIVLEIQASAPQVNTAFATLVFEVIVEDDTAPAVPLAFGAPYYTGSYNTITGLAMEAAITLSEGYDASVQFALEGEHAQWFSVVAVGNTATLQVSSAIPGAVLSSNHQLVFIITATRPGATAAQATIVISLTDDDNVGGPTLGFDRVTYLGTIENNVANIGPITVIEGYTDGVTFGLYGDLASYFTTTAQGSVVNVAIQSPIPDSLIPPNRIIVLEIQASAPQVNTAFATLVFEVIVEDDTTPAVPLAFGAPYYTGSYNTITGLAMEAAITLSEGYDASVQFALEGEHAQWFSVVAVGNTATLQVSSAIPGAVLSSNHQLVFIITATRPGATAAQATIVISLTDDENIDGPTLGFDRVTYLGTIENNVANIGPITVIEGYTDGVTFGLYGDLASYFTITALGSVVNVAIQSPIPDSLIPPNRIIVLEIQASAPQVNTAFATLVFEVIVEDDTAPAVPLAFGAPYYTGSYNTITGLAMEAAITLSEGYDASVQFALEGEHAQWFSVVAVGNTATLQVSSAIPGAVLSSNHQLVFIITATRPGATAAQATIVISLTDDENIDGPTLGFDRVTYLGTIENNVANIGPITVIEGYTDGVTFGLYGDLASYFTTTAQGSVVNVAIQSPIPDSLIPPNRIIVLEIQASAPQVNTAFATLVFEVIVEDDTAPAVPLAFGAPYYTGSYNTITGLAMEAAITLSEGYDASVQFALEGEHAQWFSVVAVGNTATLQVSSAIPGAVLSSNHQLVFIITATRPGATAAQATIVISLTDDENIDGPTLGFDRVTYLGTIENNVANIGPITVIEGYTDGVTFGLYGDLASYFTITALGSVVNVAIQSPIPDSLIPPNRIIVLEIQASAPQVNTAFATLVFEVIVEDDTAPAVPLAFGAPYYTGSYNTITGLAMEAAITLSEGYDASVQFALEGEHAQWFSVVAVGNTATLQVSSAIPGAVLSSNHQLVFIITATRPGATAAQATIVISLTDDENIDGPTLGFDRVTYLGTIENNVANIGPITVIEGYTDGVTFGLYGDLASYFTTTALGSVVNVAIQSPIPDSLIPPNRIIVLEIQASAPQVNTGFATLVFEVIVEDNTAPAVPLAFGAPYYTGSYNTLTGLAMEAAITLSEGYDASVQFALEGEHARWFSVVAVGNTATLQVSSAIPGAVLSSNHQLVFIITATRPGAIAAQATIVISLISGDSQAGDDVSFEKVLYEGIIQHNEIQHEVILISGYDGTSVDIIGAYSSLFVAYVVDGVVSVQASGSMTLPTDVTRLALELHAASARAVLLLNVLQSDVPVLPTVTFSSESYVLTVEIVQTGIIGHVLATADNGEPVTYSIATDNTHLQTRLSVNNEGALYLSAPANSGVYNFQVIATTAITQATGTVPVYLTVEAITVCGENNIVVPPLIIVDRDEEEAHNNLVVLDSTQYAGCHFSLTNRWPTDQTWLYVDENGLHTTAIDREHPSIAFMALSQVQVELILHCDSDNTLRTKRSTRTDWLGPYDYGTNKWILTDTIPYNSRRSLVNLIVNDINDNAPIFVGKENEPIAVGYPTDELEERILPRSLAELQATDADIGENAAITYWSSESVLAVAPTSGFVHVRAGARLQHDQLLNVSATDQRGQGLTGTIQLVVKLLELNNIAVVTVRDAFLDDEMAVLAQLSDAVGYEVKTLRSVVISDGLDEDFTRKKRETDTVGASLQLYVYGLIEREPVAVDRLTADINNNAVIVSVVSTIPLEDHLQDSEINIIERDVGLLVATIVLSVLLFLLILLIAIWYFLIWRKNRTYDEFSDDNSLTSRNGSLGELPKPEPLKPRLNLEDLKKSERRLQEMLNAPIEQVTVEPMTSRKETPLESILDLPLSETHAPIVIQSIDKLKDAEDTDDEFGEITKEATRRKSVVTFNENVEKIIHVEDDTDDVDSSSQSGYEIYKL